MNDPILGDGYTGAQVERDRFGKAMRVTGINLDITDQYQLEQELRRAKDLADEASASKSQFLANMSHEIRTPMNGVLGMLELVKRTTLNDQQQEYIQKADSAARSLLGILNDILDYSKITAGKMALDPVEFNVDAVLSELGIILAGNLRGKPVEIVLDKDVELPDNLVGDKLRLLQILINLSGNAIKFTEMGHVIIRVSMIEKHKDDVLLRIEVEDTGIGLSLEQQSRLFQSFTQAEASTARRYGGSGLGLVICKRLLELMGAELQFESSPNVGSRFWFDLKLGYVTKSKLEATHEFPNKAEHRVLVVDDSPLMADHLCAGLAARCWRVNKTCSSIKSLELIEQAIQMDDPFDVILMDWNMPEINGLEVSKRIRADEKNTCLAQIIMITAHEKELFNQVEILGEKPFDQLIVKPVTISQIEKLLLDITADGDPLESSGKIKTPKPARLSNMNILIVEDNALNRQVASELLAGEGANVDLAVCGVEGVTKVLSGSKRYDVVLMDIQMPDIDGYEATKRIRLDVNYAELPIIAMTANASESDRKQCLDAGMNAHVAKPFDVNILVPLVKKYTGMDIEVDLTSTFPVGITRDSKQEGLESGEGELIEPASVILNRFSGNRDLAARMRDRFEEEAKNLLVQMDAASQEHNLGGLISVFHSFKGVAATLGAARLAHMAAGLESSGRQGKIPSEESMVKLHRLIDESVVALKQIDFGDERKDIKAILSSVQLESLLEEIKMYLQDDNMSAMPLAEKLASNYGDYPEVKVFCDLVDSLNFSDALVSLCRVNEVLLNGEK